MSLSEYVFPNNTQNQCQGYNYSLRPHHPDIHPASKATIAVAHSIIAFYYTEHGFSCDIDDYMERITNGWTVSITSAVVLALAVEAENHSQAPTVTAPATVAASATVAAPGNVVANLPSTSQNDSIQSDILALIPYPEWRVTTKSMQQATQDPSCLLQ
ncbi:uncharacterized protein P174DRAFT_432937 [Aspergillus novofumigatus IBT 16806]|uniref:Uncharacterized protein n=1 Tax=Aspergillus novofumigatus (strain IBT 16806) TaxID=1392255 RepID=A0A2I1C1G5_ASPN1|nr:uncharacterized protein P174DRAFT_432937 [Aspergillus novofumigatus IBT 16806]PKX91486.1 hypothetical protein P174DRAFT_432937 [Aspergillus novofumigatus IBT 16806]